MDAGLPKLGGIKMSNINKIAAWFYQNNKMVQLNKDDKYLVRLCLHAKVAFLKKKIDIDLGEIKVVKNQIIFSELTQLDPKYKYDSQTEHILKTINREFGYGGSEYNPLFKAIYMQNLVKKNRTLTDNDLLESAISTRITKALIKYEDETFEDEEVVITKDLYFIVEKGVFFTEEELEDIKTFDPTGNSGARVTRDKKGELQFF